MSRKRIGELLLEQGVIDDQQLQAGLAYQRDHGGRIGAALVARGYLTEEQLMEMLGQVLNLPLIDIPDRPDAAALKLLKVKFCEDHDLFPVHLGPPRPTGRRRLTLALADPLDIPTLEEVEFVTGCRVEPGLATPSQIRVAILRHYHRQNIDQRRHGGRMTVVRPGGAEEDVDTAERPAAPEPAAAQVPSPPWRPPPLPPPSPPSGPPSFAYARRAPSRPPPALNRLGEEPEHDPLPLTDEVSARTEVAELVRERAERAGAENLLGADLQFLTGTTDAERLEALERKFWALMRIVASKGLISKDEFLAEFDR